MACLEHVCIDCEYTWFDNQRATECPKCGGHDVQTFWDEWYEEEDQWR